MNRMRVVLLLGFISLSIIAPTSLASFSKWRNCTIDKNIWPNAARWSVDEPRQESNESVNGSSPATTAKPKTPLYIAGFLPITDEFNDQLVCTVLIAVDHVNEYEGLLDDYELRIAWAWTEAQAAPALRFLYDVIYNFPQMVMVWGPTYSRVGEVLNRVAAEYHLVQVGIAQFQANEQLPMNYPYTVQIYPANTVFNPARIALLKEMGWSRAAILYQNVNLFRDEMEELVTLMQSEGMTVVAIETINDDPRTNIQSLKRHDARIVFMSSYQRMATRVFCEIYRQGLYGSKYVWVLMGWYHARWWQAETEFFLQSNPDFCTVEQVDEAVDGYLSLRGFEIQEDLSEINFNGVQPDPERLLFFEYLQKQLLTGGACDSYGYDQIITIALALNASIQRLAALNPPKTLADFTYSEKDMADIFLEEAKKVSFVGLTGHVAFDSYGSRQSNGVIQQLQNKSVEQVLVFDRIEDSIRWKRAFIWGGKIIPVSGPTHAPVPIAIGRVNRIIIYVTGSLGIVIALSFLAANIHFRNERVVKISSPVLNNVIAVGCILLYGSTFLLGETLQIHTSYSHVMINIQCQGTLIVGCVGLSLSFGALFLKTYRIHQIYTSAMKARAVRSGLSDGRLIFTLFLFVVIDLAFFIFWMTFDPTVLRSQTFAPILDLEAPELEIWFIPTMRACSSKHVLPFLIALLAYKGVLLLFGVFLAWSTRNVRISQLNDSKYIALSVYTVCLTCIITVPFAYIYYSRGDINFVFSFVAGASIIATTVVLCLVFVPKFLSIYDRSGSSSQDNGGTGSGINTASDNYLFHDKEGLMVRLQRELEEKLCERQRLLGELLSINSIIQLEAESG